MILKSIHSVIFLALVLPASSFAAKYSCNLVADTQNTQQLTAKVKAAREKKIKAKNPALSEADIKKLIERDIEAVRKKRGVAAAGSNDKKTFRQSPNSERCKTSKKAEGRERADLKKLREYDVPLVCVCSTEDKKLTDAEKNAAAAKASGEAFQKDFAARKKAGDENDAKKTESAIEAAGKKQDEEAARQLASEKAAASDAAWKEKNCFSVARTGQQCYMPTSTPPEGAVLQSENRGLGSSNKFNTYKTAEGKIITIPVKATAMPNR